jgi:phosphate transport system substrate-binding protein
VSRKRLRGVALATALCVAVAVPATAALAKPVISMSGSTSVYPLAVQLATAYVKSCKHCATFKILQGGSDVGISDVAHARVTIGDSSRDPIRGQDPSGLVFNKIARDAVCLITNRANRVANLSQSQIQAIFSGRVRNWSQVPGAGTSGAIDLYTRTATSGTADAFLRIFMLPFSVSPLASQKQSNGLVQQGVQSDPRGIGYVSLHFTAGTNPVSYNGTACTLRNSKSGAYGGVRNFYMVTRGRPTGATKKWIHWVQTSSTAARIVAGGWVPLR